MTRRRPRHRTGLENWGGQTDEERQNNERNKRTIESVNGFRYRAFMLFESCEGMSSTGM